MAKVYERMCLTDWHIEAENGDRQDFVRGKEYTTGASNPKDGTVMVYSRFWVRAPISVFEPVSDSKP